jgi:uncharacterized protein with NRDE domain
LCTVTYLPISNSSFILTHNRDEHFTRSIANLPAFYTKNNQRIVYPKDEQGGGTWFASSDKYTLCLLNGGFEKHQPKPPYKHSRGLVILDFFEFDSVESFKDDYDFSGIEPFTLLIIEHDSLKLFEFIQTETNIHYRELNAHQPAIWSSTTLYSNEARNLRLTMFSEWLLNRKIYSQEAIIQFHKYKESHIEKEGIMIDRNSILKTVSLTSVMKTDQNSISIYYEDFIQQKNLALDITEE